MNSYYSPCPVETTLNLIGNKWKLLIISKLLEGKKRFGELQRELQATKNQSISQNVLTQNLRELEEAKIVKRKVYAVVPPKVEYSLTKLGSSLKIVLDSLQSWGENYQRDYTHDFNNGENI
ncbi:transcriptional regulator [Helicobacter saguini]|uniref:Transcriptional regulator n=1 Tax=Helicobacter saguini TaxID=1548018 RepID=A0A347VLG3_9HELI|nr:helix-turn-helix domain-containing protein [Helicobacter saguini]MWV61558.1 transcriptional regulator [Helicobacter saguini]MWV67772.1 transcriptional regulator [Helicobacter saguini]MWV70760.1 transcriptional regulator [Helicobacter saguini]MWV72664.1 transcriptional regulator [Helicobacter saguini]TLD94532.1 transcriptional regulator [Helicobacter saguini]